MVHTTSDWISYSSPRSYRLKRASDHSHNQISADAIGSELRQPNFVSCVSWSGQWRTQQIDHISQSKIVCVSL